MLYAECKPDVLMGRLLTGATKRGAIHELKGKSELCKRIASQTNCVGLIDEEPWGHQPAYTQTLTVEDLPGHALRVLVDEARGNRLVVLCPSLEHWVLEGARAAGMDVSRYGLPDNWRALHNIINLRLDSFERLLKDLKDTPRFEALAGLLSGPARGSRGRKSG